MKWQFNAFIDTCQPAHSAKSDIDLNFSPFSACQRIILPRASVDCHSSQLGRFCSFICIHILNSKSVDLKHGGTFSNACEVLTFHEISGEI